MAPRALDPKCLIMIDVSPPLNTVLAATAAIALIAAQSAAQDGPDAPAVPAPEASPEVSEQVSPADAEARLDGLFARLQDPDLANWQTIEEEIWLIWSASGSATADYLLQRARTAMEAGDFHGAIAHLTAAIDHAPDFTEAYNQRATAFFQLGRFGPSIADIRQVLAQEPRHFGALSGLGQMLREMDEPRRALDVFREAAGIHPHRPDLQNAIEMLERSLEGSTL